MAAPNVSDSDVFKSEPVFLGNTLTDKSAVSTDNEDAAFQTYYSEVKLIEKEDSKLTPKQTIDRLLRPGSTYFNLNPFEVLQVASDTSIEDIKKRYRRLSILVHPDKNQDDSERAQKAFDILNRAYKTLENEEGYNRCREIIIEAKEYVAHMLGERRKQLKKEGKPPIVAEDEDPAKMKHTIYVQTTKYFADLERKRRELDNKDMEERKRKREEEIEQAELAKIKKEYDKNYDESRDSRVSSWNTFVQGQAKKKEKKDKKSKTFGGFRPPKLKPEKR